MIAADHAAEHIASRVIDSLGELGELHVELLKAEVARDALALLQDSGPLAFGLPAVVLGYAFLCVAGATAMAPLVGTGLSFAVIGALNMIAGSAAGYVALARLRLHPVLGATVGPELARSARSVVAALHADAQAGGAHHVAS